MIDTLLETEEQGTIFFNVSRGMDRHALLGDGFEVLSPDFNACAKEYVDTLRQLRLNVDRVFDDDPIAVIDRIVAENNGVIVRKIYDHERARYELVSRRKKAGLDDRQLTKLEKVFPSMTSDDVILWRMRLGGHSELTYAGIAFYGESDIMTRSPLYEPPKPGVKVQRLGQARKYPKPE